MPAHGDAAQPVVWPLVVFGDVHRELRRIELHDAPGGHVTTLRPVAVVRARAHPGFQECAVPVHPVAAAKQHGVGYSHFLVVRKLLALRNEAFRER